MRAALLLLVLVASRTWLENTMWLHMLVQIPLLVLAGVWLVARARASTESTPNLSGASNGSSRSRGHERTAMRAFNVAGVPGLLLASSAIAVWMIPRALDAAAESWAVDAVKFVLLTAAGLVGAVSWRHAGTLVRLFMLGNALWMTATVGVLLLDAPNRVCVRYGANDQQLAGYGLVFATLFVVVTALVRSSAYTSEGTSTPVAT